jgi:hypothetical protein
VSQLPNQVKAELEEFLSHLGFIQQLRKQLTDNTLFVKLPVSQWQQIYPLDKTVLDVRRRISDHGMTVMLHRGNGRDDLTDYLVFRQRRTLPERLEPLYTDGGIVCEVCGLAYREHPLDDALSTYRIHCDGRALKL